MDSAIFDQLEKTLRSRGPAAAIDRLCARLRADKDYNALFYALLMKKRHELGVSPMPTGPAQDLPASVHADYEQGIRSAAREVGELSLKDRNIPQAWWYFRMIEEPEPVRIALEGYQPSEDEDLQPLVQVAFYEGVHPRKGFDWILERFGICSAITTLGSQELPHPDPDKRYCVQKLIRSLYHELRERLTAEVEAQEAAPPESSAAPDTPGVVRKLIQGRDWLFAEEAYHIDTSHLSSVVQMSVQLEPCPEMGLARELCDYGRKLSGRFVGESDPPFRDVYLGHDHYLACLQCEDVEEHLDYFRHEADSADPEEVGTYPAEVLVNLLLRLERTQEALAVARKHLKNPEGRRLTCPDLTELCQRVGDYRTLAEVAREQGNAVYFVAGLLAARKG
jgi:hypothetical protein